MSTRGLYGFVIDGTTKVTYNHSDSYPSWLGERLLRFAREVKDWGVVERQARDLRLVDEQSTPTAEDIESLQSYADTRVGRQSLDDWYVLLRTTQGDPDRNFSAGVMTGGQEFARDGLFCEWGYLLDLDRKVFEVYRGFVDHPHSAGRFAELEPSDRNGYYPIALIASWPFDGLPEDLDEQALYEAGEAVSA